MTQSTERNRSEKLDDRLEKETRVEGTASIEINARKASLEKQ